MEKTSYHSTYPCIFALVFALAILSFVFCVLAELKKSKVEDVKLDGRLCEIQSSEAFGFGVAALICFSFAQMIGNLVIFVGCCPNITARKSTSHAKRTIIPNVLLVFSWVSFGATITLISTSASMNSTQSYGKGWLDGECYLVREGVFIASAFLVLLSLGSILSSAVLVLPINFHGSIDAKSRHDATLPQIK